MSWEGRGEASATRKTVLQNLEYLLSGHFLKRASQVAQVVRNPPAKAEDLRDVHSIPGLGRAPGGGQGNPLQYSCLENPMDRDPGGLQSMELQRAGHD